MQPDNFEDTRFTWGDSVRLTENAPKEYRKIIGDVGAVVGISRIDSEYRAAKFDLPLNSIVYTIEGSDGRDAEISEKFLERL